MYSTIPLHPHEFLKYTAVPGYAGVHLLGSFARHVTIYSQQIRAINLIDALCRTGQITSETRLIVIGGGVAGLTAAAAALVRGARVTLLEQRTDLCPIQSDAGERYLHPHIYDWPAEQTSDGRAGLPVLDWEAGTAASVFQGLKSDWNRLSTKLGAEVHLRFQVADIRYQGNELRVVSASDERSFVGDIAILAVGFGRERSRADYQTYWQNSPIDSELERKFKWLVSGSGDGALTDLMRLCVSHFRHIDFVESFAHDQSLAADLKTLLDRPSASVVETFERVYPRAKDKLSSITLRADTEVVLNASADYLESSGSAILNRFIVFHLAKSSAFTLQPGKMITEPSIPPLWNDKYHIKFEDPDFKGEFDRLVVRHGPLPAMNSQNLPSLDMACKKLRQEWQQLRTSGTVDPTRIPLFDPQDYANEGVVNSPSAPKDTLSAALPPRYLVLESSRERRPLTLSRIVKAAVSGKTYRRDMEAILLQTPPEHPMVETIIVNQALASQRDYNKTVRAICRADIAVIDVTNYEPGVMLFLGIRTIARRGVTIVTTNEPMSTATWSKLPFNLKEMYPVPARDATELGSLISNAWSQYRTTKHYQDLPAWQAVRQTSKSDIPIDPEKSILWLCSFSEEYSHEGFNEYLRSVLNDQFEAGSRLERITDIVSPQLLAQRLYSAIRFRKLCIIDWTFWSPNVFFELGVRLATNRFGPVCLLSTRSADEAGLSEQMQAQRRHLQKMFAPVWYEVSSDAPNPFPEIKSRYEQMKNAESPRRRSPIPPAFGSFPYHHTYKQVTGFLALSEEPAATNPHVFLSNVLDSLIGEGVSRPGSPVLFADDKELAEQVRKSATAIGVAAWLYMSYELLPMESLERMLLILSNAANGFALVNETSKRYEQLGDRLSSLLRMSNEAKDVQLADVLASVQERLRTPTSNDTVRSSEEVPS